MSKLKRLLTTSTRLMFGNAQERAEAKLAFFVSLKHRTARLTQKDASSYLKMQNRFYELAAAAGDVTPGQLGNDLVVGSWTEHDQWPDYDDYLMKYVPPQPTWIALEYGCGPGRNIRKYSDRFARIDGVDISQQNLINAMAFVRGQIDPGKLPKLYRTSGSDVGGAPSNSYDFCFSTICLQHICVWEVRFSILKSLFTVLKPGGRISAQMGYGPAVNTIPYRANHFAAASTNSSCDVDVQDPAQVEEDLSRIGFRNFEYWLRPPGPGDTVHQKWIFFTATKP